MKKGTFTSVWDGGVEITTSAELDETTGEITAECADVDGLDILEREFFIIDGTDEELEVCNECHEHILKNHNCPSCDETNIWQSITSGLAFI